MTRMVRLLMGSIASLTLSALITPSAEAALVAGWDFSQYVDAGVLSIDNASFSDSLKANYSDFDTEVVPGLGAQAGDFGTLHFDGLVGSTDVDENSATAVFTPFTGSLSSNLDFPAPNDFDAHTALDNDGQDFQTFLSMTATGAVNVVFEAKTPSGASDWMLTLGGKTLGGTQTVAVAFSTDGGVYIPAGNINLTDADLPFTVALATGSSSSLFVRLSFSTPVPGQIGQAIIDNVAISGTPVPGPSPVAMLLSSLGSLLWARRRHS